ILQSSEAQPPQAIEQLLAQLPKMEDETAYAERWNEVRLQLAALMKNEIVKTYIEQHIEKVNKNKKQLQQIADEQSYWLCHWQETDHRINYRRFFTVNGLICLNIQDKDVLEQHHALIKELVKEGLFQGLRVDHIDGLYNPTAYLQDLRELAGEETYIIVEKILEPNEDLPTQWPIQGNSGYDFLSIVNNLFTQKKNEKAFTDFYQQLINDATSIHQHLHDKKSHILYHHMRGELENLYQLFMGSNLVQKEDYAAMRTEDIKTAIAEFLIQCPVYRYYGNRLPLQGGEALAVQDIFHRVRNSRSDLTKAVNLLEEVLFKRTETSDKEYKENALRFYKRCMQFTGPLMAKGVEDTLMYTYNRFIGHNEVGDSPEAFGYTTKEFHQKMVQRQELWPLSLNATSTHDTKRGEDVRARLNVLTDLTEEWFQKVREWQQLNKDIKQNGFPDVNDEYFIYQTLVGTYPLLQAEEKDYPTRLQEYLQKALREAKRHSNWTIPNEEYESATKAFAVQLLDKSGLFWKSIEPFVQKVADYGIVNSLAQVLLKFTCPGVPDVYQGCELWDLSFVDPDNRRPVDYEQRRQGLNAITGNEERIKTALLQELWEHRATAQIKLWLVHHLLQLRRQQPALFSVGEYIPLQVEGTYKDHVLAFARKHRQTVYLIAVPLHSAQLCREQDKEVLELDWKDTRIHLPENVQDEWEHLLLSVKGVAKKKIAVKDIFKQLPFALLQLQIAENRRGAGVLLHITSLPSLFGIGDLGPEAKAFADFLYRSRQKFWQLLPLNPTEAGQAHSPYSAISSRAGNPLLISPEVLVKDGLLNAKEVEYYQLPQKSVTNYTEAERLKAKLFDRAYAAFKESKAGALKTEYQQFCEKEKDWIDDYALYRIIKQLYDNLPWYQWPEEYKLRKQQALNKVVRDKTDTLEREKWLQFIFFRQWHGLKAYCNQHEIQLIGDLPFYVSYDSVDVWAHQSIFALNEEGEMTSVAGVPPDAFSDTGQLWGMPVFRWNVLKERGYDWWIDRLRKNVEMYDLLRLDHFRAFSDFWEVPASEKTAINGEWKAGPGHDFFNEVQKQFGHLPFIAEDLGDIDEAVYVLRDAFGLPGMKVLQFAFGDNLPHSEHIPHNYTTHFVAYTGTHDNNTVRGWYRRDAGAQSRQLLEQYAGKPVLEEDVH
ncbi:MAG: malto-oligosyltrehalose synthase, partial [Flavisolibacter sp.]|nr:malto-oligosyltrehalose synthase [Flavisolibacter sp.]